MVRVESPDESATFGSMVDLDPTVCLSGFFALINGIFRSKSLRTIQLRGVEESTIHRRRLQFAQRQSPQVSDVGDVLPVKAYSEGYLVNADQKCAHTFDEDDALARAASDDKVTQLRRNRKASSFAMRLTPKVPSPFSNWFRRTRALEKHAVVLQPVPVRLLGG